MPILSRRAVVAAVAAVPFAPYIAQAQQYPQRNIRVVVPYAAGGASDIIARLVAAQMSAELGRQLFVDNRGGGASIVGTQIVADAEPDGYTIGVVDTAFTINPGLFGPKLPYDTKAAFKPVSLLAKTSLILVVGNELPVKSVADLVALAKSKAGGLTMATAGLGTAVHLCCEQFRQEAGIQATTVPYRGGGPSIVDVIAGKVDFTFSTIPAVLEHIRGGELKALGVTTGRIAQLPDVPSMAETGLAKVDAAPDFGIVAPARVPDPIIARISEAAQTAIKSGPTRKRIEDIGYEPVGSTPEEYASYIDASIEKWKKVIDIGKIKPED